MSVFEWPLETGFTVLFFFTSVFVGYKIKSSIFSKQTIPVEVILAGKLLIQMKDSVIFVCIVALRPKSTAMVIAGRSVHLTTLISWASLNKQLTSNRAHTFACN